MEAISGIAVNTFRETVREKLLYVAVSFGVILIASTYVLSPLAVGARDKMVVDVGLGGISILAVVTAIFVGSTLVNKEIRKRAVHIILTRPVNRLQYILGKFAGVLTALYMMMLIMAAILSATILISRGGIETAVLAAVYMSMLEAAVMCSVVIFFSSFTSPVLTMFFSVCVFVAGSLSGDLRAFTERFGGVAVKFIMDVFYYILPNLSVFNLRHQAVHNLGFSAGDVGMASLYALAYCGVLLYFAYLLFSRREFA